jgi:cytochrome c553
MEVLKIRSRTTLVAIAAAGLMIFAQRVASFESATSTLTPKPADDPRRAVAADPEDVVSVDACVKCHPAEVAVWRNTPHHQTFERLHRLPEAKEIASRVGVRSIKYDNRCVACHYTQKMDQASPVAIAGVSCESCHGAARQWVDIHHDYGGGGVTADTETPAHRDARVARSIEAGMRNPANVYLIAQSCYRCHTVQDEELVNVGQHNAGSLDFEFVSWSQGTLRHNFVRSNGLVNDPSSQERLRVMFVAGMIADLEASLRATAVATEKRDFGINAAERANRAAQRLQSVAAKIDNPLLDKILKIFSEAKLRRNNQHQLTVAADLIAVLGYELADSNDGVALQPLDGFIPSRDQWK